MSQQPFWKKKSKKSLNLKNASFVHKHGIYLPNHANLIKKDLNFIVKSFKQIAKPIFFN